MTPCASCDALPPPSGAHFCDQCGAALPEATPPLAGGAAGDLALATADGTSPPVGASLPMDHTPPPAADGSSPTVADGSQPTAVDGSRPTAVDGSLATAVDGSPPPAADGWQPTLADAWPPAAGTPLVGVGSPALFLLSASLAPPEAVPAVGVAMREGGSADSAGERQVARFVPFASRRALPRRA